LKQGSPNYNPNLVRKAISSGCKDTLSTMKNYIFTKHFVDLVECDMARNNHMIKMSGSRTIV